MFHWSLCVRTGCHCSRLYVAVDNNVGVVHVCIYSYAFLCFVSYVSVPVGSGAQVAHIVASCFVVAAVGLEVSFPSVSYHKQASYNESNDTNGFHCSGHVVVRVCMLNRVRASRLFKTLSTATFGHRIYIRPNWIMLENIIARTRPSKIKSCSNSKCRRASRSPTLQQSYECSTMNQIIIHAVIAFVGVVHIHFNGPHLKIRFLIASGSECDFKCIKFWFSHTFSPIKFIESEPTDWCWEKLHQFRFPNDANKNNYSLFLLIARFGSHTHTATNEWACNLGSAISNRIWFGQTEYHCKFCCE